MSGEKSLLSCKVPGSTPISHFLAHTFTELVNISYDQNKFCRPRLTFLPSFMCFGSAEHTQVKSHHLRTSTLFHVYLMFIMFSLFFDRENMLYVKHKVLRPRGVFLPSLSCFSPAEHHQTKVVCDWSRCCLIENMNIPHESANNENINMCHSQKKCLRSRGIFPPSIVCFGSAEHNQTELVDCSSIVV